MRKIQLEKTRRPQSLPSPTLSLAIYFYIVCVTTDISSIISTAVFYLRLLFVNYINFYASSALRVTIISVGTGSFTDSEFFVSDLLMVYKTRNLMFPEKRVSGSQEPEGTYPVGIYLLKVNNRTTRTRCEICSKLTIKTPE